MGTEPISSKALHAAITAAKDKAGKFISGQIARRGSEYVPYADPSADALMDEALSVLSGSASSATATANLWLKGMLSQRPVCFENEAARRFIEQPDVVSLAKTCIRKHLALHAIDEERSRARAIYASLFEGEPAYGERVFDDAVGFVLKSLTVPLTPSDRVIVDVLRESAANVNTRLDGIAATEMYAAESLASLRSDMMNQLSATESVARIVEDLAQEARMRNPLKDIKSRLFGAPQFARAMLPRTSISDKLRNALLVESSSSPRIVLVGQGGSGKSTIAGIIANDDRICQHFEDGVFWISLGQNPELASCQAVWLNFLTDRPIMFPNVLAATTFMRAHFRTRRALLIIDDVWAISDLKAFDVAGQNCATLITTRDYRFAEHADLIPVGGLAGAEPVALLKLRAGIVSAPDAELEALSALLDHLPLALELAAYQLRSGMAIEDLMAAIGTEIGMLDRLSIPGHEYEVDPQVARNQSLDACLNLSLHRMTYQLVDRFTRLTIARPGSTFGDLFAARIWNCPLWEARESLRQLWSMSLVEAADVEAPAVRNRYRLHAVIRAKGLASLSDGGGNVIVNMTRKEIIENYLMCANPNYPVAWHTVEDDGNILSNLVYYLAAIQNDRALISMLSHGDKISGDTSNSWQRLRASRQEGEAFGADIQHMLEYFRAQDTRGRSEILFEGLVRSFLTAVSLADMNRDIDPPLGLALLRSELWNEGQLASHARRRYPPGNIIAIARELSEPLRTATLRSAVFMMVGMRPQAVLADELVRIAEVFPAAERRVIAQAAIRMMRISLDGEGDSALTESHGQAGAAAESYGYGGAISLAIAKLKGGAKASPRVRDAAAARFVRDGFPVSQRIGFLRSALLAFERIDEASREGWHPQKWIEGFLEAYEKLTPLLTVNGLAFASEFHRLGKFEEISESTVDLLETLLFLGQAPAFNVEKRALKLAGIYLDQHLRDADALTPLRLKLATLCDESYTHLRDLAQTCFVKSICYDSDRSQQICLWPLDGFEGLTRLLLDTFADDQIFVTEVIATGRVTPAFLAFIEGLFGRLEPGERRDELLRLLADRFPATVGRLLCDGAIGPLGVGNFVITREHIELLGMLVRVNAVSGLISDKKLFKNLARISSSFDRVRILELMLPCLTYVSPHLATEFCRLIGHRPSAALAWLSTGSVVAEEHRANFLIEALRLVGDVEPSIFLANLSRYIGRYSDEHAVQLAHVAAVLAAGIGDAQSLCAPFVAASLDLPPDERRSKVLAPLWFTWDTLPTHAPIDPIPRCMSLVEPPFWLNTDMQKLRADQHGANDNFLDLSRDYFSTVEEDRSRIRVYECSADIAREFSLRGLTRYSAIIAEAMFDIAHFYK